MGIFRLHGVLLSLGLPLLAQMLSPLGYYYIKCGVTKISPQKRMESQAPTPNGKVKVRDGFETVVHILLQASGGCVTDSVYI